jgi:hypothetical protein
MEEPTEPRDGALDQLDRVRLTKPFGTGASLAASVLLLPEARRAWRRLLAQPPRSRAVGLASIAISVAVAVFCVGSLVAGHGKVAAYTAGVFLLGSAVGGFGMGLWKLRRRRGDRDARYGPFP